MFALNACPQGILDFELGGYLPLPGGLDRLVMGLRPYRQLAWRTFGPGAGPANWTGATNPRVKADAHDRIAGHIAAWRPFDTGMSLWAAGLVRLPINHKGLQVIALSCQPLPAIRAKGWPNYINVMLRLGGDQEVRIDVAAVEQVRTREEIPLGEVVVDAGAHHAILCRRGRGDHLSNQIRLVGITRFREMHLIPNPMGIPFTTVAGLQVVGRRDAHRRRWLFVPCTPAKRFEPRDGTAVILLEPYLPKRLQGWKVSQV